MVINKQELFNFLSIMSFSKNGDKNEINFGNLLLHDFPLLEKFWVYFIVPQTKRIESIIDATKYSIRKRDETSDEIFTIACQHYSMFLNILYAYNHLNNEHISFFEDFYIHLGSVCDLTEDFITNYYLFSSYCKGSTIETLQKLSKNDFLKIAKEWYDENYSKIYEFYLQKGKLIPIKIPNRSNILKEFFKNSKEWNDYTRYAQKIREYRNIIVHNIQIGSITITNGTKYVPKKEAIQNYRTWKDVFSITSDPKIFQRDFIPQHQQMHNDFNELLKILNPIWDIIIKDFIALFHEGNSKLLESLCITYE